MNLEDERRLKFDVRLRNRRGWVSDDEFQAYQASLADVSGKIKKEDDSQGDPSAGKSESDAPPA